MNRFCMKRFCAYCGMELTENCEREAAEYEEEYIEELEERQHQSGFYAFQDMIEMHRREK